MLLGRQAVWSSVPMYFPDIPRVHQDMMAFSLPLTLSALRIISTAKYKMPWSKRDYGCCPFIEGFGITRVV